MRGDLIKPYLLVAAPNKPENTGGVTLLEQTAKFDVVINNTPKGYMTAGVFECWLKHLRAEMQHKEKVILLLDGHRSHCTVEVQTMAKRLNIVLVYLPPNTTHGLQIMDQLFHRFNEARVLAHQELVPDVHLNMDLKIGIHITVVALDKMASISRQEVVGAWRACGITQSGFDKRYLRQPPPPSSNVTATSLPQNTEEDSPQLDSQPTEPVLLSPATARRLAVKFKTLKSDLKQATSRTREIQAQQEGTVRGTLLAQQESLQGSKAKKFKVKARGRAADFDDGQADTEEKRAEKAWRSQEAEVRQWLQSCSVEVPPMGQRFGIKAQKEALQKLGFSPKATAKEVHQQLLQAMTHDSEQEAASAAATAATAIQPSAASGDATTPAIPPEETEEDDWDAEDSQPAVFNSSEIQVDHALIEAELGKLGPEDKIYWQKMKSRI